MEVNSEWVGIASLAFAVVVQTGTFGYFLGAISTELKRAKEDIRRLEDDESTDGNSRSALTSKLAVMESEMKHLTKSVEALQRTADGLSRQLSALVTHDRRGAVPAMADAQTL